MFRAGLESDQPHVIRRIGLYDGQLYLDKNYRSLRRRERRPSYAHTAAPVLGPRAVTPGVVATTGPSRSTCLLLRALQRRRVESLVLGALSSSPVHRALVLVLGTNVAVLLGCSKSSRQYSLSYLLTYLQTARLTLGCEPLPGPIAPPCYAVYPLGDVTTLLYLYVSVKVFLHV